MQTTQPNYRGQVLFVVNWVATRGATSDRHFGCRMSDIGQVDKRLIPSAYGCPLLDIGLPIKRPKILLHKVPITYELKKMPLQFSGQHVRLRITKSYGFDSRVGSIKFGFETFYQEIFTTITRSMEVSGVLPPCFRKHVKPLVLRLIVL